MQAVIRLQLPSAFIQACRQHQIAPKQVIEHFFSYLSLYNYLDPSESLASLRATRIFHEFHLTRSQLQPPDNFPVHTTNRAKLAELIALINSDEKHEAKRALYQKMISDWFNQITHP